MINYLDVFRVLKENRMKHALTLILASALALSACAKKAEKVTLKEGTPAYTLAKDLAAIVPALGPDKTTVLVKTKGFDVTAADVIQAAWENLGKRSEQLKTFDAGKIKTTIDRAATSFAERKLLLAAAAAAKTVVPAEELNTALQSEYQQAGGEEAFLTALKGADISIDHVKKSIEETILINKLLAGIAEKGAAVSEDDLRKAFEQESSGDKTASVRHILLMTQGKSDQEKAAIRTRIEGILAEAKAGADFVELVKKYSEDTGSKDNGGLYENFPRGQMVKPFEDAAFSVPIGELSGVVETEYGYHVLKVVGREKETRTFEEARAEIESRLKQGKEGTAVQDYVKGLKDKAQFKLIGL
jgi:parvulin-like peptidyl-prolyl isomerase